MLNSVSLKCTMSQSVFRYQYLYILPPVISVDSENFACLFKSKFLAFFTTFIFGLISKTEQVHYTDI